MDQWLAVSPRFSEILDEICTQRVTVVNNNVVIAVCFST